MICACGGCASACTRVYACVCTMWGCPCRSQKTVLDPVELELRVLVNPWYGCWEQLFCNSGSCSQLLSLQTEMFEVFLQFVENIRVLIIKVTLRHPQKVEPVKWCFLGAVSKKKKKMSFWDLFKGIWFRAHHLSCLLPISRSLPVFPFLFCPWWRFFCGNLVALPAL